MEFRKANESDVPWLARMNRELIRDEGHRNPMDESQLAERMASWLAGQYEATIFSADGVDLGYALYKRDPDQVYLRQFLVDRKHRRGGIGRTAIAWLKAHAWQGSPRIRVEVLTGNHVGIAFWRAMGFDDYCLTLETDLRCHGSA